MARTTTVVAEATIPPDLTRRLETARRKHEQAVAEWRKADSELASVLNDLRRERLDVTPAIVDAAHARLPQAQAKVDRFKVAVREAAEELDDAEFDAQVAMLPPETGDLKRRLRATEERLAATREPLEALSAAQNRFRMGPSPLTRAEFLRLAAQEPDLLREQFTLQAEAHELREAIGAANEARRQATRAAFRTRKGPILRRLDAALEAAARLNADLQQVEAEEIQACGSSASCIWPELLAETPQSGSRLADWRRYVRTEGHEL